MRVSVLNLAESGDLEEIAAVRILVVIHNRPILLILAGRRCVVGTNKLSKANADEKFVVSVSLKYVISASTNRSLHVFNFSWMLSGLRAVLTFRPLKAIAHARRRVNDLLSGEALSVDALAKREGVDCRSVRRPLRLGFLSPCIVEAIAEGRQTPDLTVIALSRRIDLSTVSSAQEQALRIA
jgi:hypothetical protein